MTRIDILAPRPTPKNGDERDALNPAARRHLACLANRPQAATRTRRAMTRRHRHAIAEALRTGRYDA